jgi:hypothetical protein
MALYSTWGCPWTKTRFLGTSGQNIEDLEKYSEAEERLDFMERTLVWRHLAPTAPDTLGCYPFTDRDPFIVEMCPHVYFCGNQPSYASRLLKGPSGQQVRLICIPSFQETSSVVLVSLKTWDSHILTFSANSFQPWNYEIFADVFLNWKSQRTKCSQHADMETSVTCMTSVTFSTLFF